jgi:hypothetical protein
MNEMKMKWECPYDEQQCEHPRCLGDNPDYCDPSCIAARAKTLRAAKKSVPQPSSQETKKLTATEQAISVLEWARFGDREHALDCVAEAISLLKPDPSVDTKSMPTEVPATQPEAMKPDNKDSQFEELPPLDVRGDDRKRALRHIEEAAKGAVTPQRIAVEVLAEVYSRERQLLQALTDLAAAHEEIHKLSSRVDEYLAKETEAVEAMAKMREAISIAYKLLTTPMMEEVYRIAVARLLEDVLGKSEAPSE